MPMKRSEERIWPRILKLAIIQILVFFVLFAVMTVCQFIILNFMVDDDLSEAKESLIRVAGEGETLVSFDASQYDMDKQAMTDAGAFLIGRELEKNPDFKPDKKLLAQYALKTDAANVLLVEKSKGGQWNVVASANQLDFDPNDKMFRGLLENSEDQFLPYVEFPADHMEDTNADYVRVYAGYIEPGKVFLMEMMDYDLQIFRGYQDSTWQELISKMTVANGGFSFISSKDTGQITVHPDEKMIGKPISYYGITEKYLDETVMDFCFSPNGSYVCKSMKTSEEEENHNYVTIMMPLKVLMNRILKSALLITVLIDFAFLLLIIFCYSSMVEYNKEREKRSEEEDKKVRSTIRRRVWTLVFVAMLIVSGFIYCGEMLFITADQAMSNTRDLQNLQELQTITEARIEESIYRYDERHKRQAMVAAQILSNDHSLWNRADLQKLNEAMFLNGIMLFDQEGKEILSDTSFVNFQITNDPDDPYHDFWYLTKGVPCLTERKAFDDVDGIRKVRAGAVLTDEKGNTDGFVIIALYPDELGELLEGDTIAGILDSGDTHKNDDAVVFAVNEKDHTITYHTEEKYIDLPMEEYGITKEAFHSGYSEYLKLDGERCLTTCIKDGNEYVFVAVPQSIMSAMAFMVVVVSVPIGLLNCIIIMWIMFARFRRKRRKGKRKRSGKKARMPREPGKVVDEDAEDIIVDVQMPNGEIKQNITINKRWANPKLLPQDMTPGQLTFAVARVLFFVLAVAVCLLMLNADVNSDASFNHMISFILSRNWKRGFHVFSLACCFMFICSLYVAVVIARAVISALMKVASVKGETILRLIRDFIKYIAIIAVICMCLSYCGVNTRTMLASAGIVSIAIGIGANKLIGDVLAGLFIIAEGDFQVGDIITIDGVRGTVQEIGIRTTKILDGDNNIQIFNNSAIGTLVNMTQKSSMAYVEYKIYCDETPDAIEAILQKEMDKRKNDIPKSIEGPRYLGITALGPHYIQVMIIANCNEKDRSSVTRELHRMMKKIISENGLILVSEQILREGPLEPENQGAKPKGKAEDEFL